jgi:hypothetical protein
MQATMIQVAQRKKMRLADNYLAAHRAMIALGQNLQDPNFTQQFPFLLST